VSLQAPLAIPEYELLEDRAPALPIKRGSTRG
jgi:hypothetical protein